MLSTDARLYGRDARLYVLPARASYRSHTVLTPTRFVIFTVSCISQLSAHTVSMHVATHWLMACLSRESST